MNGDKAVVVVSFAVNEDEKVEDVELTTPFYLEFDKITKKAISSSPNWLPSIDHSRKVKLWMRQPVTFEQFLLLTNIALTTSSLKKG